MTWIQDTLTTARNQFVERAGNPFVIGFAVAWICLNIDIVVAVLGDGNFQAKVAYLEKLERGLPQLVGWPAAAGALWPISDLVLSAAAKLISNWKQRLGLLIDRKTPIDSRRQKEFFTTLEADLKAKEGEVDELQKDLGSINEAYSSIHKDLVWRHRLALFDNHFRSTLSQRLCDDQNTSERALEARISTALPDGQLEHFLGPTYNQVLRALRAAQEEEPNVTEIWLTQSAKVPHNQSRATVNALVSLGLVNEYLMAGELIRRFVRHTETWKSLELTARAAEHLVYAQGITVHSGHRRDEHEEGTRDKDSPSTPAP